jgi:hypothetical protein
MMGKNKSEPVGPFTMTRNGKKVSEVFRTMRAVKLHVLGINAAADVMDVPLFDKVIVRDANGRVVYRQSQGDK